MKYHPKKSTWVKRCSVCNRTIASWNKSGMCSACHKDIYHKPEGGKQNGDKD